MAQYFFVFFLVSQLFVTLYYPCVWPMPQTCELELRSPHLNHKHIPLLIHCDKTNQLVAIIKIKHMQGRFSVSFPSIQFFCHVAEFMSLNPSPVYIPSPGWLLVWAIIAFIILVVHFVPAQWNLSSCSALTMIYPLWSLLLLRIEFLIYR